MAHSHSKNDWKKKTLEPALKKAPEREDRFETSSGFPIDALYAPEDVADLDYPEDAGYPGEYPFTRGVQPSMYRGRFWTMRQYAGFGDAEESNRRYHYLLEHGQTGLSVAFDLPTQLGMDSDDLRAEGEIGKVGVAIDSLQDMETLFQGIPLDKVSTSMTINSTAAVLLAMYVAVGKKEGVEPRYLNGTVQNDILKEYIARGTYIFPPQPSMRLVTDIFGYCREQVPNWNTISISGYHIREAGATAAQEVAFTLANGMAYVQAAIESGLDVDAFGGRLSFFFASYNNLLEEIAKFRAARRLWARMMRDRFQAKDARSWMLRFHTQTAGSTLTAQQPANNIVRTAIQALAAVFGGTQSLHTNSQDEAFSLPSEESVQIALRTQQIIAHESGVADTVDPLGGSYYIEWLTEQMVQAAQHYLDQVDALGGALEALSKGYQQREIQDSAYRYQQEIESGKRVIVGVNRYVGPAVKVTGLLRVDPAIQRRQADRLAALRRTRDNGRVDAALKGLETAAGGSENLMPHVLECVEAYATIGEICGVLRRIWGEQGEFVAF